ncbi:MAG: SxtJ family membrane protein [Acidimicrobiia bacterium]
MITARRDTKQLRSFGLMVGGIFGAIGLWPMVVRGGNPRLWALALAVALVLPALVLPRSLGPVYRAWMALGTALNWINARIILGAIFYVLITPMGVALRLWGRDQMGRRFPTTTDTYRVARRPRPAAHMMRQF